MDIQLALFNPEIPQNTGNVARLSAGFQVPLHIVGEAKFSMTEKALRRSGLDYWPLVDLYHQPTIWHLLEATGATRVVPITTRGKTPLAQMKFLPGDVLAFGNESSGLPPEIHRDFGANSCRIEQTGDIRCLNLATAAGIVIWEALRQLRSGSESQPGDHRHEP